MKITSEVEETGPILRFSQLEEDVLYEIISDNYRGYVVTCPGFDLMYSISPKVMGWREMSNSLLFLFRRLPPGFKVIIEQE